MVKFLLKFLVLFMLCKLFRVTIVEEWVNDVSLFPDRQRFKTLKKYNWINELINFGPVTLFYDLITLQQKFGKLQAKANRDKNQVLKNKSKRFGDVISNMRFNKGRSLERKVSRCDGKKKKVPSDLKLFVCRCSFRFKYRSARWIIR